MTNYRSRVTAVLLALIVALLGGASTVVAQPLATAQAECGDTSEFEQVPLGDLPAEATDTYELIETDGPYPYPQDGTTFQNREGLLPDCDTGYYAEFTVETPGIDHRGARRIVTGDGGEFFYTADHYESFVLIRI
ncbi:ribonuclease domain-containing protein [Prauserella cavernicola]|uniref:Ribonuclease n=1 Tax=Prauserella cavernicola TaxID=2800127 RepID=A0A934V734_9PSEU|nr:ribonuclease domain-containing protein [Prauserella cavernicola]MBK1786835.1 ribonuclease [Prauserella cavernicola]